MLKISVHGWIESARALALAAPLSVFGVHAHAAVAISDGATLNMSCEGGVCAPTSADAVLNTGDLETFLASGDVTVTTTGSGVQANDIVVKSALGWAQPSSLALDAYRSVTINKPVSVTGTGGLSIVTNDGGSGGALRFGGHGNVTFQDLSSALSINGAAYTLENSIQSLAAAIAANPSGDFALAADYDASADGTYPSSPIPTTFTGAFDGLGNAVLKLKISDNLERQEAAFFTEVGTGGSISHLSMTDLQITDTNDGGACGMVGSSFGTLFQDSASGSMSAKRGGLEAGGLVCANIAGVVAESSAAVAITVQGAGSVAGGLLAYNFESGLIIDSLATGDVTTTGEKNLAGELVGEFEFGTLVKSYATGSVSCSKNCRGGGLVGWDLGENGGPVSVTDCYATGSVTGGSQSQIGGLVGEASGAKTESSLSSSYSTGAVSATPGTRTHVGGLIGDDAAQTNSSAYWDTDTSGITNLSQGAGNIPNDPGITGLTTAQFQSGLPKGFNKKIWAENPNINGGLPYLRDNAPPK